MPTNLLDTLGSIADIVSANWPPKMPAPPKPPSWTLGTPTIDIVIPCRGDELVNIPAFSDKPLSGGLMMTVTSCEKLLARSKYDYRYYIVSNGNEATDEKAEAFGRAIEYIKNTGHLGKVLYENTVLSPPSARNIGAAAGSGDLIFFFDNHCLVHEGFFSSGVETFKITGADSLHGVTDWDGEIGYHYLLSNVEDCFLGWLNSAPQVLDIPYRIGAGGHGAFAIKRSVWKEVDGYWDGFVGFAGEEHYLDLKLAMMDKSNWLDPRMSHWHHAKRVRDYKNMRVELPVVITNKLATANIIGGAAWAERVADIYYRRSLRNWLGHSKQYYDALLQTAIERSEARRLWFDSKKQRTLEQQLSKFGLEGVAC